MCVIVSCLIVSNLFWRLSAPQQPSTHSIQSGRAGSRECDGLQKTGAKRRNRGVAAGFWRGLFGMPKKILIFFEKTLKFWKTQP
jgi:hypothetical protein